MAAADRDLPKRSGLMLAGDLPESRVGREIAGWKLVVFLGMAGGAQHFRVEPVRGGPPADLYLLALAPAARAAFDAVTQRARRVGHPLLATPIEAGLTEVEEERYVVFPIHAGTALSQVLPPSGMPPSRVARIGTALAGALQVLHAHEVYVGGLPVSAVVEGEWGALRIPGVPWRVDGTVGSYLEEAMAPEGAAGPASDQYALGMLLRRLLAGTARSAPTGTPDALLDVIARLTQQVPTERFADLATVERRLRAITDAAPPPGPRRRPTGLLLVGGAILVLLFGTVGIGGLGLLLRSETPADPVLPASNALRAEPGRAPLVSPLPRPEPPARPAITRPPPVSAAPRPRPAPVAVPASEAPPVPVEVVRLPDPEVPPEPTAVGPAPPPVPEPVAPEPAPFDPSPHAGRWSGERAGRPLVLELSLRPRGGIGGVSKVRVGPRETVLPVEGTWTRRDQGVWVVITEQGPRPTRYEGLLWGTSGGGTVSSGGKERGTWSVTR